MNSILKKYLFIWLFVSITTGMLPDNTWGNTASGSAPLISIDLKNADIDNPDEAAVVLKVFLLLTVLSLVPAILIMLTSFTRIVIVLSLLRQAIGTQQMPPNQIIIGLSLFLTFFVMTPVWQNINRNALTPYMEKKISGKKALETAIQPVRGFMFKQTREKDLAMLVKIADLKRPKNINDIPTSILVPSFIISELKSAFIIGFLLYVPFLIVDMVVASVLLSMGMMMLPPIMVSLPFKLMLFVLADGWNLIVGSLVKSFS
ncbi:flagellar biosynthetic protein FliP [Desulfosarcina sp. BuS5]|uniref:flagellar type III secretion system pore protein FliP n=1 Tax=Desulfosarcina sp. BuS5 TaxID=933262 RepID=UPI0004822B30|nr:flagellar type III secretion system pore protein FliP [Desulfosarcina sp. BuS5]WDN90036.1 flagellar biosynthetic protein FliP [Desulfosarcina sp. BuS5]